MTDSGFRGVLPNPEVYTPEGNPPLGVDLQIWLQGNEAALAAKAHAHAGSLKEARRLAERAADFFTRAGDKRQSIASQMFICDIALRQRPVIEVMTMYETVSANARINGYVDLEAISLLRAAALYKLEGDLEICAAYMKRAAAIDPGLAAPSGRSRPPVASPASSAPGVTQRPKSDAAERPPDSVPVDDMLEMANGLLGSLGDEDLNFFAFWTKGEALRVRGAHQEATEAFTNALRAAKGAEESPMNKLQLISSMLGRAESSIALGCPREALLDTEEVLRLAPLDPRARTTAAADLWLQDHLRIRGCNLAGEALLLLGQTEDAEASMAEALNICLAWKGVPIPKRTVWEVLNAFGNCFLSLGKLLVGTHRPELGLEKSQSALRAFGSTGNQSGQAAAHMEIANALSAIERTDRRRALGSRTQASAPSAEIIANFDASRDLFEKVGDRRGMQPLLAPRYLFYSRLDGPRRHSKRWANRWPCTRRAELSRGYARIGSARGTPVISLVCPTGLEGLFGRHTKSLMTAP